MTAAAHSPASIARLGQTANGATGTVLVTDDAVLFDGHYPGRPIVPGLLIVDTIIDIGRQVTDHPHWDIVSASFRDVVEPPAELAVALTLKPDGSLSASCRRGDAIVATVRLCRAMGTS